MSPTAENVIAIAKERLGYSDDNPVFGIELQMILLGVEELKAKTPDVWNLAFTEPFLFETGEYRTPHRDIAVEAELMTPSEVEIAQKLWRREEARRRPQDAPEPFSADDFRREIEFSASQAPQSRQAAPSHPQPPRNAPQPPSALRNPPSGPEAPPKPAEAVLTPEKRKPRAVSTDSLGEPVILDLVCEKCGATFTKPKTRGRRPRFCTSCVPPSRAAKRR